MSTFNAIMIRLSLAATLSAWLLTGHAAVEAPLDSMALYQANCAACQMVWHPLRPMVRTPARHAPTKALCPLDRKGIADVMFPCEMWNPPPRAAIRQRAGRIGAARIPENEFDRGIAAFGPIG